MKLMPINTSGRSKLEIVKAVEAKLAPFLMDTLDHPFVLGHCEKCVQVYLDRMLSNYDASMATTEMQIDVGITQPIQIERWEN